MPSINEKIHGFIKRANVQARGSSINRRYRRNLSAPSAAWIAPSLIGRTQAKAIAIVLATIGCSHAREEDGGCTMCSYLLDGSGVMPTNVELIKQFERGYTKANNEQKPLSVKIYTSGSFLDSDEVSPEVRMEILRRVGSDDRVTEVIIESRPEFVTDRTMQDLRERLSDRRIEIGMGLESANDVIREVCINKGFTLTEFQHALETARKYDIGTRAYVLLKPPFLTESQSQADALQTIKTCADIGVTTVSVNPVNIQKNTLVEKLWSRGSYRPPWLWTLISVLRRARQEIDDSVNIVCDPVAAGKSRGVHNCGKCDERVVRAIREFSLTQNEDVFEGLDCDCKEKWHHTLQHEDISFLIHR